MVVTIISMLMALLAPSLKGAKESAKKSQCLSNLRQIGLAVRMYADDYNDYPPPSQGTNTVNGVTASTFPYTTFLVSYSQKIKNTSATIFVCPTKTMNVTPPSTYEGGARTYAVNQLIFGDDQNSGAYAPIKLSSIKRPSEVILLGDSGQVLVYSGSCESQLIGFPFSLQNPPSTAQNAYALTSKVTASQTNNDNIPTGRLRYRHAASANVLMADGHAEGLRLGNLTYGHVFPLK